jgi:bifunctional DNA-binding transcriptional regulator/antitoxin component of YhaV-PrlF toxin-antitoxin module
VGDTILSTAREITFHARVEKGHRIAIPASERAAGAIEPGDLVRVSLVKVRTAPGAPQ